jgi:LPXTG-motif cell wall-anchored protein
MSRSRIVRIAAVSAVGALGALGALLPIGVAGAYPNPTPPNVAPADQGQTSVEPNQITKPSTLPFTGTDVAGLVAIGGASIGVGAVLVRRSRRVRTS